MDTNQQDERAPHCLRLGASRTVVTVGRYNYSLTAAGQTACKQTNARHEGAIRRYHFPQLRDMIPFAAIQCA